jgi:hypothetical protein
MAVTGSQTRTRTFTPTCISLRMRPTAVWWRAGICELVHGLDFQLLPRDMSRSGFRRQSVMYTWPLPGFAIAPASVIACSRVSAIWQSVS